jgi:acetyltransferase-like isoleucine patch superfamily enzyme
MMRPVRPSQLLRRIRDRGASVVVDRLLRPALERLIDDRRLNSPLFFGPPERVTIAPTAQVNNALFNTWSGTITIGDHAFFAQNVVIAAGSHDVEAIGEARSAAVPTEGFDVVIERGVWIATGAVVLGPCSIGADAVIAAGSIVTSDVAPRTVVAGVPARPIRSIWR